MEALNGTAVSAFSEKFLFSDIVISKCTSMIVMYRPRVDIRGVGGRVWRGAGD